jgi:Tat protein translocase TatB subunit
MYYIFILESIGTSELILIGLVALIVFGPRKLPEFARTMGKLMNEFRRSTDDFKQTWAREVEFENDEKDITAKQNSPIENPTILEDSIERKAHKIESETIAPEIREINQDEFQKIILSKESEAKKQPEDKITDKRDWL